MPGKHGQLYCLIYPNNQPGTVLSIKSWSLATPLFIVLYSYLGAQTFEYREITAMQEKDIRLNLTVFSRVNPLPLLWTIGSVKYLNGKLHSIDLFGYDFSKQDPRGSRENGRVITLAASGIDDLTFNFWESAYYKNLYA